MKRSISLLFVGLLVFQLTGCMAITGKRFGANIDDTVIVTSIKSKFMFNNDVHAFWMNVNSHNGDVVLIGSVQTRDEEDIAIRLAKSVDSVRSVTSFLKVKDLNDSQQASFYDEAPLD